MKIYFSHPCSTRGTDEESKILTRLRSLGDVVNPFEIKGISKLELRASKEGWTPDLSERLVIKEKAEIKDSDMILVWLDFSNSPCIGSVMEMLYTYTYSSAEIHVITDNVVHPWILSHADVIYLTVDDYLSGNIYIDNREDGVMYV